MLKLVPRDSAMSRTHEEHASDSVHFLNNIFFI